eukprot:COSAG06_NODE_9559_length_1871_cov_1.327314_2_plen_155_part_01
MLQVEEMLNGASRVDPSLASDKRTVQAQDEYTDRLDDDEDRHQKLQEEERQWERLQAFLEAEELHRTGPRPKKPAKQAKQAKQAVDMGATHPWSAESNATLVADVRTYMKANKLSQITVGEETRISQGVISPWLSLKYHGNNDKVGCASPPPPLS